MKHEKFIHRLVVEFKRKLNELSTEQLEKLNPQITLTPAVGHEAGGSTANLRKKRPPTSPSLPVEPQKPGSTIPPLQKAN
ncbi:hypothetical protein [Legionella micdadei]|uniref:Uncharacterized protein n=1 Tax=Legionella micdadei TaxID=451 RepID=A0A098GGB8_LEGMI|nr:hypothetical protein [Legionella micdadei]ARG97068.1 hypothetical protein B6N58_04965 [Legionella micdadei]ARH00673.1 hypothetical protein B6V88_09730 [Legionella micdadei]KTD26794.1 hypothetical protein Lmic_2888 [Legionella micdadei]NSL18293.1 hypothetical protein [Legionella micdadei]CEG61508.1 protein of unknown function [Legionella micdadei]